MAEQALNESERYRRELAPKIAAATTTCPQRIRDEGLEIEYAPAEDHLYVTIGESHASEALPLDDGTYAVLLLDPVTHVIHALEAPFFLEFLDRSNHEFWRVIASMIKRKGNYIYIPPRAEGEKAGQLLSDLVLT